MEELLDEDYLDIKSQIEIIKNKLLEIDNELTGRSDREHLLKCIEDNKITGKIVDIIQNAEIRAIELRKELNEAIKLISSNI